MDCKGNSQATEKDGLEVAEPIFILRGHTSETEAEKETRGPEASGLSPNPMTCKVWRWDDDLGRVWLEYGPFIRRLPWWTAVVEKRRKVCCFF